jgi:hypothetical protein
MQSEETIRRGRWKMVLVRTEEQKFPRKPLSNFFSYIPNERQTRTNEMSVGYEAGEGEEKISSESILTEIRLFTSKRAQSFVSSVSAKFVSTH